jgi:aminopeptidase N
MTRRPVLVLTALGACLLVVVGAVAGARRAPAGGRADRALAPAGARADAGGAGGARPGARGLGDPYFPDAGNGGYDVRHYDLDLRWDPGSGRMAGRATITARATQALSSFTLDLVGMRIEGVTVDGDRAPARREGHRDVRITPRRPLAGGARFTVVVAYDGGQNRVGEVSPVQPGWFADDTGDVYTVFEPIGAATLFPSNDHPSDKASYRFRVTVPATLVAVTNGRLVRTTTDAGRRTWEYDEPDPMASYLVQVAIGNLDVVRGRGPGGLPLRDAIDEDVGRRPAALARVGDMIDFYDGVFGPFPFGTYGGLVVDDNLGFALETQTLTLFGEDAADEPTVVAHELAHQWFGDDVSLGSWRDIWLNEGFATYASWLWEEHDRGVPVADNAALAARSSGNGVPPGDPGPEHLFAGSVYERGALTLYVLRHAIGDDDFTTLLRTWVRRYGGRSATTADFEALAEEVSGRDLGPLFDAWLRSPDTPRLSDWVGGDDPAVR